MIELFTFLEKNKAEIIEDLMERIPATVPSYMKVPKPELRQSLEHLLEAYGDYLVTGEPDTLTSVLRYITKVRAQQSFKLSDGDRIEDARWLSELVRITARELPAPKPRKRKKKG